MGGQCALPPSSLRSFGLQVECERMEEADRHGGLRMGLFYRIQYAFIRITDENSGLPKFVQIVRPSFLTFPPSFHPF